LSVRASSGSDVCGRVDDHVGRHPAHRFGQAGQVGEIAAQAAGVGCRVEVQRHQFAQHRQAALQLPSDLAAAAEQQYLHVVTCS
jgi:hypothetical protein